MKAPHDIKAEQCVLAALLHRPGTAERVKLRLKTPYCFYDRGNQALFVALTNLAERGEEADWVTTAAEVERLGMLRNFRGRQDCEDYVRALAEDVPEARDGDFNLPGWLNIVHERWIERESQNTAYRIGDEIADPTVSAPEKLRELQDEIGKLLRLSEGRALVRFGDVADDILTDALDRKDDAQRLAELGVLGLPSGVPGLTELVGGFKPGTVILIGGPPKKGKSTLMMQIAGAVSRTAAARHDGAEKGGAYVASLEMSATELVEKVLLAEAQIDSMQLHAGTFDDDDATTLEKTISKLRGERIFIDDLKGSPWSEIRGSIIAAREEFGIEAAFIDYVQEIKKERGSRLDKKDHLGEIASDMKTLAKQLGITIFSMSQLKRPQGRSKKQAEPQIFDIAESTNLERAADMIILIWNRGPEQLSEYERHQRFIGNAVAHQRDMTTLKVVSRATRDGMIETVFNMTLGRFEAPKPISDQFTQETPGRLPDKDSASLDQFPDPNLNEKDQA